MFYQQKNDVFIRIYDDIGYIINRNNWDDARVVSQSGAMFLSALNRTPQTLDELVEKIIRHFIDVDIETIKHDVKDFYDIFEQDGFIVSGETIEKTNEKDVRFSYKNQTIKNGLSPIIVRAEKPVYSFLEEHFKDKPKLTNLQIELTSKCNEKCIHCYIPHENKTEDIVPELFYSVLEQCNEIGVLDLTLSGGEPLSHKNICEFLHMCAKYDFSLTVLSNLTLLNDNIIAAMKANRFCTVRASLYSMNPKIHDEITQMSGSFEKTKNAILKLVDNDIPLEIASLTMKQNKDCTGDVINWANKLKVRCVIDPNMMAKYDNTTQNLNNRPTIDEMESIIIDILKHNVEYQEFAAAAISAEKDSRDKTDDRVCSVGLRGIAMNASGNVYPCPGWHSYHIGNIKETPLKEIWDNSEKLKYLRGLRKRDFPKCVKCEELNFCSICMARNANEANGDFFKINDHFCQVAKLNKKIVMDWKEKLKSA